MPFLGLASVRVLAGADALDVAINDAAGNQLAGFDPSKPTTAVLTSVATTTASSVVLLAANVARHGFYVHNVSGRPLHVAFAATSSATAFTFIIPANQGFEGPLKGYTGDISGILTGGASTGTAKVTELT